MEDRSFVPVMNICTYSNRTVSFFQRTWRTGCLMMLKTLMNPTVRLFREMQRGMRNAAPAYYRPQKKKKKVQ